VLGHRAAREFDAEGAIRPLAALLDELRTGGAVDPAVEPEPTAHLLAGALYEAALWIGEQPVPKRALPRAMAVVARLLGALAPPPSPRRARAPARPR
jgi:hypothetical protein